jgi:protein-S-isoprenylcysteine O-methyltransferase Ste14
MTATGEGRLTEWLLRCFAVVVYCFAVSNIAHGWWVDPTRWSLLLLLVSEAYTLGLMLFARRARLRDMAPLSLAATIYAVLFVVVLSPDGTQRFVPESVGIVIQTASLLWVFASKYTLGRSFGLLPAQRGIVIAGPYRWIRHPIYFGYLVGHVGFLLVNFSWRNAVVLALLYVAQVVRILREEQVLGSDATYLRYRERVRWRLVPGLF